MDNLDAERIHGKHGDLAQCPGRVLLFCRRHVALCVSAFKEASSIGSCEIQTSMTSTSCCWQVSGLREKAANHAASRRSRLSGDDAASYGSVCGQLHLNRSL